MDKFKLGDRVRLIAEDPDGLIEIGDEGTVRLDPDDPGLGCYYTYECSSDRDVVVQWDTCTDGWGPEDNYWFVPEGCLALVEETVE